LKIKTSHINSLILLALVCLFSFSAHAQGERMYRKWVNCKIILNNGDTILARTKPKGQYIRKIVIKRNNKRERIKIGHIDFMKINLIKYSRVDVYGQDRMLEEVAYGYYTLYAYDQFKGHRVDRYFFIELDNLSNELVRIDPYNYKQICRELIDDDEILDKIENDEWGYKQITRAFRVYNVRKSREEEKN